MGKDLNGKQIGKGITQRKDGRYQARFVDRFGKRQTITGKNLREVKEKLRKDKRSDELHTNSKETDYTLNEWFEEWLRTCKIGVRASTIVTYRTQYNRVQNSLGRLKMSEITALQMQRELNKIESEESRFTTWKILKGLWKSAKLMGLVEEEIPQKTRVVRQKRSGANGRRVLTIEEECLLLSHSRCNQHHNLILVALETGMRIGELAGLQWKDINFESRMISVCRTLTYYPVDGNHYDYEIHEPKTTQGMRKIPMTSKCFEALKSRREVCSLQDDFVFRNRNGGLIMDQTIRKALEGICAEIGMERVHPHSLRHTFATRCIESGMNPKVLQSILGHSTITMTMDLYCHVTDDTLISEMKRKNGGNLVHPDE